MFELLGNMAPGMVVILLLRLIIPLTIFRWPLWGAVASLLIDALDCQIATAFGCSIPNYILRDKYLDLYYLTIELAVSRKWANKIASKAALVLYIWRLAGMVIFHLTGEEKWLIIAPNIFEYFFLFIVLLQFLEKETKTKFWLDSPKRLWRLLTFLFIIKTPQEIVLHSWKEPAQAFYSWIRNIF